LEPDIARVRARFAERAEKDGVSSEWRTMKGHPAHNAILSARYTDLVVIGQAYPAGPSVESDFQEEVVLAAGRPVLVVPHAGKFSDVGRRAMVAWNGSREAARAVHDGMPLLADAE
jgi:hypothetical protein